jgi:hypothetical protein
VSTGSAAAEVRDALARAADVAGAGRAGNDHASRAASTKKIAPKIATGTPPMAPYAL